MKTYKQIKTIGMKKLQLLCLLMLAFFTFSCYDDSDILSRLDAMESNRVASIETQIAAAQNSIEALQAADVALDKYIDALEAKSDSLTQELQNSDQQLDNRIDEVYEMTMKEFTLVNAEIQALNSQDSLLNVRLTELNDYIAQVEAQQKAEHDWVQQTFSTLKQYEATCAAIAGLEAHLQTVDGKLLDLTQALAEQKQALEQSIADAVTSVKSWVNEQLSGYYTIAQTDAKIAAVLDTMTQENAELRQQLTQMQDSLAQTRIDLTTAYQSAIKQAIEEHDGKITKEIAAQVESLNKRIDDEVAAINAQLQALADRVAALEKEMEELKKIPGITFDEANPSYVPGEVVNVAFTLSNADENTVVEALANGLWEAEVEMSAYDKGNIKVTTPDSGGKGKVLVFVNKGGQTIMRNLLFDQGAVTIANDLYTVAPGDTILSVELSTNLPTYEVQIPQTAQSWIRQTNSRTRAAMHSETLMLEIDANATAQDRSAVIQVVGTGDMTNLASFVIYQQSDVMGNNEIWYTSTDGNIVEPNNTLAFGANIISNTYVNGKGVILFDDDLTSVLSGAFKSNYSLKTITLPESINTLGESVFQYCSSLTQIDLPDGIVKIGGSSFYGCESLIEINLPSSLNLKKCGSKIFYECTSLVKANLKDLPKAEYIPYSMFQGCSALVEVIMPKCILEIDHDVFYNCSSLKTINWPDSLTTIASSAFKKCTSIENINLPEGITSLGQNAFEGCSSLVNVTLPSTLTEIGKYAFNSCKLLSILEINAMDATLAENSFHSCLSLRTVVLGASGISANSHAFDGCFLDKCELIVPVGTKAEYESKSVWKNFSVIKEAE